MEDTAKATEITSADQRAAARVYYDGGCPVCRREIGWYQTMRDGDRIEWLDISNLDTVPNGLPEGTTLEDLMRRFTITRVDGTTVSGGAGFISLWRALGPTRWLGRLSDHTVGIWLGERLYRGFLRLRKLWR